MKGILSRVVFSLVAFVFLAGPARADDEMQKAKEHFQAAEAHYKLGRFKDALQEYSRAYEFAPLPAFLFNMGQCYRQLGNPERAVFFYEGYLREKPDARNREIVLKLIDQSRREIEREQAEKESQAQLQAEQERKAAEAEKLRLENERKLVLERARLEAQALAGKQKPMAVAPAFYEKWWFWTIVGGALAVIAGGTVLAMTAEDNLVLPGGSLGTLDLRGSGP